MIVLGLILVLLAVGAGVILFLATDSLTTPIDLELAGYSWGMTPLALLITGAAVLLLLWLGLAMIRASSKRRRRPAREAKEAERQAKIEESIRADERARAEESHQSALAERDRVRDEEFEARMAERDRERETEFATRQQDAEERARAYERERLEQEYAARGAAPGHSATAAVAGAGAGLAASHAGHVDHVGPEQPATGDEFAARHSADAPADSGETAATSSSTVGAGEDDSTRTMSADDSTTRGTAAGEDETSNDPNHPAHRTVADKIMGRYPVESSEFSESSESSDTADATVHGDAADTADRTEDSQRAAGSDRTGRE
ncbi:hypothetical protein [Pedococcus bigeumensis]|uniref:hypothetical protein n=1 Tax=Pedococcus bigeumensis TaxID=433644 RepID=UPI002FE952FB